MCTYGSIGVPGAFSGRDRADARAVVATRAFSASLVPRDGLIDSLMHPGNPAPSLKINDGSAIDESATTTVALRRADIRRLAELR